MVLRLGIRWGFISTACWLVGVTGCRLSSGDGLVVDFDLREFAYLDPADAQAHRAGSPRRSALRLFARERLYVTSRRLRVEATSETMTGTEDDGRQRVRSVKEARMGTEILKKLGLESDCRIIRQSYDEILHDQFDSILAIESLKHSQDLYLTFRSLSESLKTGGNFIIVEDLATDNPDKHRYSYIYKRGWEVSRLFTRSHYEETLRRIGLEMVMEKDLTKYISLRSSSYLDRRIHRLKPMANLPFVGKYLQIYLAGLVQELFYALNSMAYKVMVFKKA